MTDDVRRLVVDAGASQAVLSTASLLSAAGNPCFGVEEMVPSSVGL